MIRLSDTVAFTLLAIDENQPPEKELVLDEGLWQEHGIAPCGNALGIAQFQAMICLTLDDWGQGWRHGSFAGRGRWTSDTLCDLNLVADSENSSGRSSTSILAKDWFI